ncbi:MAG: hypothetical protein HRT36_05915 [Alphaproteobacteria bacterium]|nr:hypothetical protein [Alphaproteobacteria bacterium]
MSHSVSPLRPHAHNFGVADPEFRVFDAHGLHIVDVPNTPSANILAVEMMIAEKASKDITAA